MALLHLEFRNAVPQEATYPVGAFEHGDAVTGPGELLSGGEPCWSRANDGNAASGQRGWSLRGYPAFIEGSIDDLNLDLLDGDRWLIDPNHAC